MQMQLKVVKADGGVEEYLHTKVMCTVSNCLSVVGEDDIELAEELAEVVTYFLYSRHERSRVTSNKIFSVVKTVLSSTGNEAAAEALVEYHFRRKMCRRRVEVVEGGEGDEQGGGRASRWDKSKIADDLVGTHGMSMHIARAIASMVEEKVLGMRVGKIRTNLVRELVYSDTAVVLRAERELLSV